MSEKTHSSGWVWISTEDSIQRGQISRLALLEIPLAMAFFWWLSSLSPWPWLTLIGLMAAPVLLLRSPESVAAGKEMLGRYWKNEDVSTTQGWLIGLLIVGLPVGLSYWVTQHLLLLEQTGWAAFWREAMLRRELVAFAVVAIIVAAVTVYAAAFGAVVVAAAFSAAVVAAVVAFAIYTAAFGIPIAATAAISIVANTVSKEALNKSTSDQRRANPPAPIRQWGFGE